MSRILALMAVALSAWYLGRRQRRTQLQHRMQAMVSSLLGAGGKGAPATLDEMAAATTSAAAISSSVAESAGRVATRNAPEVTGTAAQGAGGAATSVREASGVVANRVQHAPQMETGGEPERAELAAGVAAPNSIHTAVATPPPAPHETVGVPEPLLPELTPGEPATGGSARPSQPPSRPDSAKTPTTGMEQPPVVDRAAEAARRTSGRFVGNKSTRVYHPATSGDLPSERHRVYFDTEEEASAAGFRPAGNEGQPGGSAKRHHR